MSSNKLIEIKPGAGLNSGLVPSAEPAEGAIWRAARNCWVRDLTLEHSLGKAAIFSSLSNRPRVMAQIFTTAGVKRLYFEDSGSVRKLEGTTATTIGVISTAGSPDFETFGDWLLVTDNISPLKLWKNTGSLDIIADANTRFTRCKIIRRLAQHVIAYNTGGTNFASQTSFHWCSANDPEVWTPLPTNSARDLNIRNLDSEIVAVEPLGAAHAVYSQNNLVLVRYLGPTQWFGTPNQGLQGIGAVSKRAVVSLGNINIGISRAGVFLTDGNSFTYIDRPYIDKWLQSNVNWATPDEIAGYWDDRLQAVVWALPLVTGGKVGLTLDPKLAGGPRPFSFIDADFKFGLKRDVFEFPITSFGKVLYNVSLPDTVVGNFSASTHLFDAGDNQTYKSWDRVVLTGKIDPTSQIRFGYADEPQIEAIEWDNWSTIDSSNVPFGPRESIYLAMELKGTSTFRLSGLTVYGEKAGMV